MSDLYNQLLKSVSISNQDCVPTHEFFSKFSAAELHRVVPGRTLSISLTDKDCEQNCAHCNGHYLKGMSSLPQAMQVTAAEFDSILISGGSNINGKVDFSQHINNILQLPEHLAINLHPGFQPPDELHALTRRKPTISFDIPADEQVINNVYGLPYSAKDYRELFCSYASVFRTIPHLTLGLNDRDNSGELETIEFLAAQKPEMLVFIIFRPTPKTRMSDRQPPAMERLTEVFRLTTELIKCPVLLGCMRPAGQYRTDLDIIAWMYGIKKIVQPDHKLLKILSDNDIRLINHSNCCALND